MAEFVNVCACYAGLAQEFYGGPQSPHCASDNNLALIRLVMPRGYDGQIFHNETGEYYPCDMVWQADISADGCWRSCDLPLNSDLSPRTVSGDPLTYYEVAVFINGKQCAVEKFVLDGNVNDFPEPPECVSLQDITWTSVPSDVSDYFSKQVRKAETAWLGIPGCGIEICPGDNPSGNLGNGHQPIIQAQISGDPTNALVCNMDGLYVEQRGDLAEFSINDLADVNAVLSDGIVLVYNQTTNSFEETTVCELVADNCNASLVENLDGSFTFTDNAGNTTTTSPRQSVVQWCVIDANNNKFTAYQIPNPDGSPGPTNYINAGGTLSTPVAPLTNC